MNLPKEVRLYIEAKNTEDSADVTPQPGTSKRSNRPGVIRRSFQELFVKDVKQRFVSVEIILSGGITNTYDDFLEGCLNHKESIHCLLVDSDGFFDSSSLDDDLQYLLFDRKKNSFKVYCQTRLKSNKIEDDNLRSLMENLGQINSLNDFRGVLNNTQCYLMVQATEAWFLADPDALEDYFGEGVDQGILENELRKEEYSGSIEKISPKHLEMTIKRMIKKATLSTYKKGKDQAEILARLQVDKLRKVLPAFERMYSSWEEMIDQLAK